MRPSRHHRGQLAAAAMALSAAVAGCSGSSSTAATATPPSAAPIPSAESSASTVDTATPEPTTTPSLTPAPTPTVSAPQSKFEADPAVKAVRAWLAQSAKTTNTGHYDSPALDALMTAPLRAQMRGILIGDVHRYYPGPGPFQPISVRLLSTAHREITGCEIDAGFALNRTTKKPDERLVINAARYSVILAQGRWLVNEITLAPGVSCKSVVIPKVLW